MMALRSFSGAMAAIPEEPNGLEDALLLPALPEPPPLPVAPAPPPSLATPPSIDSAKGFSF